VLIGGTTGTGKTVLVQQLAFAAAARGPVLFVSPEMDGDQLYTREVVRRSRVPEINRVVWFLNGENPAIRDIRREDAQSKHEAAMAAIDAENTQVLLLDLPDAIINIDLVADAARQVKGLSLVVVDYAQEIATDDPRRPRFLSVGDVARGSVRIARSLKVPVIVTSQVNVVGGDKKAERDPKVDDYEFRESKVMEQKASVSLILMTRPNESGRFNDDDAFVQLASRKVRSGPRIELRLRWAQELFSFSEQEYALVTSPAPPPTNSPDLLFQ
jgi:replicative DNA helicase